MNVINDCLGKIREWTRNCCEETFTELKTRGERVHK